MHAQSDTQARLRNRMASANHRSDSDSRQTPRSTEFSDGTRAAIGFTIGRLLALLDISQTLRNHLWQEACKSTSSSEYWDAVCLSPRETVPKIVELVRQALAEIQVHDSVAYNIFLNELNAVLTDIGDRLPTALSTIDCARLKHGYDFER
jgi:hypothetical protein